MFVLRYKAGGPKYWKEYAYKETVDVYDKIAVVNQKDTVTYLQVCLFELLGEIRRKEDLSEFLANLDKPKDPDILVSEDSVDVVPARPDLIDIEGE